MIVTEHIRMMIERAHAACVQAEHLDQNRDAVVAEERDMIDSTINRLLAGAEIDCLHALGEIQTERFEFSFGNLPNRGFAQIPKPGNNNG